MSAVEVTRPREGVAQLTLNRPERRNALNYELLSGLYGALDDLAGDATCRVIVLTGAGTGFCSGLDLAEGATPPDVTGSGRAHRQESAAAVAEIGAEIATARALRDLGDKLLAVASADIAAIEHKDVPLTS